MSAAGVVDLADGLVCPVCKGTLAFAAGVVDCTACGRSYPQGVGGWVDLMPPGLDRDPEWRRRQDECDAWYAGLVADPGGAGHCFHQDYEPHAAFLGTLTGDVLDVGGGNGVTRHYLPRARRYTNVEPSTRWAELDWRPLAPRFPCLASPQPFVRAVAEHLPFPPARFDAVLSFWSLNHVLDPAAAMAEMIRVLRPGGALLIVLEDMPPRWRDLAGSVRRNRGWRGAWALATEKLKLGVLGRDWPLQSDHIQVREPDLGRWGGENTEPVRRAWVGNYLTYELRRR